MKASLNHYWPYCVFAVLTVFVAQVQANTTITVKVTIVSPPPCTINANSTLDVTFGNDVIISHIDGSYKKQPVPYSVVCKNMPKNAMKLQVQGTAAGFNASILKTNKNTMGIALLRNGNPQPVNSWIAFTYPNLPTLEAVLVRQAGATLDGGDFSAGATMKVEYQ